MQTLFIRTNATAIEIGERMKDMVMTLSVSYDETETTAAKVDEALNILLETATSTEGVLEHCAVGELERDRFIVLGDSVRALGKVIGWAAAFVNRHETATMRHRFACNGYLLKYARESITEEIRETAMRIADSAGDRSEHARQTFKELNELQKILSDIVKLESYSEVKEL